MRAIVFICLIISFMSCTTSKKVGSDSYQTMTNKLNGTWVTVQLEMNGALLPESTFQNQKLILHDSTYTFIAESVDKGIVKYQDDKMDIYGKEGVNAGKLFTAIYKFENANLVICYNLAGDKYPESFETKGKPMYFIAVFKKQ